MYNLITLSSLWICNKGGPTYMNIGFNEHENGTSLPVWFSFVILSVCLSDFMSVCLSITLSVCNLLLLSLGCQVQFYDIPGRRYHISKAYDQVTRSLDECRKRCAGDDNCWALMHYNTSNLCALTNLTVIFGYGCDYCFSARKGNCIQRK